MKLSELTIPQLKLEMQLHEKGKSIYNAALKELESRYNKPPDLSSEPALVEALTAINLSALDSPATPGSPLGREEWTPLGDGVHQWNEQEGIIINGAKLDARVRPLETFYDSFDEPHQRLLMIESVEVNLPDDLRLCRRTTTPQPMPAIDWSQAPEWANYWVIDTDGMAYWCKREPTWDEDLYQWHLGQGLGYRFFDFAASLQQRPPAAQEDTPTGDA